MATNDLASQINAGEIIVKYINPDTLKRMWDERVKALASQMDDESANQLASDASSFEIKITGEGNKVKAENVLAESYLINYLKSHGVPMSGGEGGTVHNVDGSTYTSSVPPQLQETPLPWYELPIMDIKNEADNFLAITFPDEIEAAQSRAIEEIKEAATPYITEYVSEYLSQHLSGGA